MSIIKYSLLVFFTLALSACGGSKSNDISVAVSDTDGVVAEAEGDAANDGNGAVGDTSGVIEGVSTKAEQPDLMEGMDITESQESLGLNVKYPISFSKNKATFLYTPAQTGFLVLKYISKDTVGNLRLSVLQADKNKKFNDSLAIDTNQVFLVVSLIEGVEETIQLETYPASNNLQGELIVTELNKETLELLDNEYLVYLDVESVKNCTDPDKSLEEEKTAGAEIFNFMDNSLYLRNLSMPVEEALTLTMSDNIFKLSWFDTYNSFTSKGDLTGSFNLKSGSVNYTVKTVDKYADYECTYTMKALGEIILY